jgi:hypothetical protein
VCVRACTYLQVDKKRDKFKLKSDELATENVEMTINQKHNVICSISNTYATNCVSRLDTPSAKSTMVTLVGKESGGGGV